jgi:holin-like protein
MKNIAYTLFAIALSLALGKLVNALLAGLPASLYGMIFYCVLLQMNIIDAKRVSKTNLWLVKHMGVCFVPAGIGIINHFELIKEHGVALISIIFVSSFILLTLIGWLSERFLQNPHLATTSTHLTKTR